MLHLGPDNALILLSTEHGNVPWKRFFFSRFCHLANKITLFALRLRREDLWQRKCCRSVLSRGRYETVSGTRSPSDISTHGRNRGEQEEKRDLCMGSTKPWSASRVLWRTVIGRFPASEEKSAPLHPTLFSYQRCSGTPCPLVKQFS